MDSGIFLIIRFALDDKLKPVYLAALRAMSALLWKPLDMVGVSEIDLRLFCVDIFFQAHFWRINTIMFENAEWYIT